jgi:hypothetical protein
MDQDELIRTAHRVYGKSIRRIAWEAGHARTTVRTVLAGPEPRHRSAKGPLCRDMDVGGHGTPHDQRARGKTMRFELQPVSSLRVVWVKHE